MARCVECGYDFAEGSARLASRCGVFSTDVNGILQVTALDVLLRRPDPRTWSPLEYAAHVSEAISWYVARVRRVLSEEVPQLEAFDWDVAARDRNYRGRAVETVTNDLRQACATLAEAAGSIAGNDLVRVGIGSDGTSRTVRVLLARAGHELAHHEMDIRRGVQAAGV